MRAAFTLADGRARRRAAQYRDWYGLPERIATTLTGLAGRADRTQALSDVLLAGADTLAAVAETRGWHMMTPMRRSAALTALSPS